MKTMKLYKQMLQELRQTLADLSQGFGQDCRDLFIISDEDKVKVYKAALELTNELRAFSLN